LFGQQLLLSTDYSQESDSSRTTLRRGGKEREREREREKEREKEREREG
jgi:hypothetical protein